jgi:hypothetical protein
MISEGLLVTKLADGINDHRGLLNQSWLTLF